MRLILNADNSGRHSFEDVETFSIDDKTLTIWKMDHPTKVPVKYNRVSINISGCKNLSIILEWKGPHE